MDGSTGPRAGREELEGVKVADFSAVIAGPWCTRLLADHGADVVKVEPPGGDHMRSVPPLREGHSPVFGFMNAGKRSVQLDLRTAEGREAALAVIGWADVVVENYRPGVMDRLGLGYGAVAARDPGIVYCSVSGYGQVGPWIDRPALAPVVHATSGFDITFQGHQPGMEAPPVSGLFVADILGATLAFGGVLAALRARERTGVGRHVDVALVDGMYSLLASEVVRAQFPGPATGRGYPPFRASDGWVMIAAISQRLFEAMVGAIGRPDLVEDPRFVTNELRWRHTRELEALVEGWTRTRTAKECERAMLAAGVPASRYRGAAEQLDDEQAAARGSFVTVEDAAGPYRVVDSPLHMTVPGGGTGTANDESDRRGRVPSLGADTEAVLRQVLGEERGAAILDTLRHGAHTP